MGSIFDLPICEQDEPVSVVSHQAAELIGCEHGLANEPSACAQSPLIVRLILQAAPLKMRWKFDLSLWSNPILQHRSC